MGSRIEKARWLEPIGQTFAIAAFAVQFFYVDPASTDMVRGYFGREQASLARIENHVAGIYKPTLLESLLVTPTLEMAPIQIADAQKRRSRPWLFGLFVFGGALTVLGKSASIRYSKR